MLTVLFLGLAACGSADVSSACEAYEEAWLACIDIAFDANEADKSSIEAVARGTCAAYEDVEDKDTEALLDCYADTFRTGDCSDPEAYIRVTESLADCG